MTAHNDETNFTKFEDFSYFDNLALWYLCNETPPQTLALAFLEADEKVCGAMLGVLDPQRRKYIHQLMSEEKDSPKNKRFAATKGLFIIAEGILIRGLIRKEGRYYFGSPKDGVEIKS